MPGPFVVGSKFKCFLNGLEIVSGAVKISRKGVSDVKATTAGPVGGAMTGKTTITINMPIFSASPLEVADVAQALTSTPGLFNLVDLVNGTTRSANVMISDEDTSFDPEKLGEQDWTLNVLGEIIKA